MQILQRWHGFPSGWEAIYVAEEIYYQHADVVIIAVTLVTKVSEETS